MLPEAKYYRVNVKVRNNRLLKAIESVGGVLGQIWCKSNGLSYSSVRNLVNLTASPLHNGELSHTATMLCDILNATPEDLWSNEQIYPLEKNFSELEMDYSQIVKLSNEGEGSYLMDTTHIENEQVSKIVDDVLNTLTDREKEVLRLRFDNDLTRPEVGRVLGVSGERIMQIEEKALRKLRHPSRSDILRPIYLEEA